MKPLTNIYVNMLHWDYAVWRAHFCFRKEKLYSEASTNNLEASYTDVFRQELVARDILIFNQGYWNQEIDNVKIYYGYFLNLRFETHIIW